MLTTKMRVNGQLIVNGEPHHEKPGAGTELKKLLESIGIVAKPKCGCDAMARRMDREGEEWCREHWEEIVDVMEKEAHRRKLPFMRIVGKRLVMLAVKRSLQNNLQPT